MSVFLKFGAKVGLRDKTSELDAFIYGGGGIRGPDDCRFLNPDIDLFSRCGLDRAAGIARRGVAICRSRQSGGVRYDDSRRQIGSFTSIPTPKISVSMRISTPAMP